MNSESSCCLEEARRLSVNSSKPDCKLTLVAAGKSLSELQDAVSLHERRNQLTEQTEQRDKALAMLAISAEEIIAAEAKLELLRAELANARSDLDASENAACQLIVLGYWEQGNAVGAIRNQIAGYVGLSSAIGLVTRAIQDQTEKLRTTAEKDALSRLESILPKLLETETADHKITDIFKRADVVRQDKQLQKMVSEGGGFRSQSNSAVEEFLAGGDTQTSRAVNEAFSKIAASRQLADEMAVALKQGTPELKAQSVAQGHEGKRGKYLASSIDARQAVVRDIVIPALSDARSNAMLGFVGEWTDKLQIESADDPIAVGEEALRRRERGISAKFFPWQDPKQTKS